MKKGFTIVEFIISFSLTMVIAVFLFQIIIIMRNLFENNGVKTALLNKQYLISEHINSNIKEKGLYTISNCGDTCYEFVNYDGTRKQLVIDYSNNTFEFGDYKTSLPKEMYFKNMTVNVIYAPTFSKLKNNAILNINIPIYSAKLDQSVSVNIVYQFNANNVVLDIEGAS